MNKQHKLAVSVDFKETSRHLFSESLYLAKRANLEVVIIHVNTDTSKTESYFDDLISDMIDDYKEAAEGVKISYYGIRLKNRKPIFHKTFNPELYLYGLNLVKDHAILVNDMVKCAKRIGEGEPVICNFGMPYLSPTQCQLINRLKKVDLEVTPKIAPMVATHLKTYYRFI